MNVNEVSGCETANTYCTAYSAISLIEDGEEYISPNFVGSTTVCQVLTVQCSYIYYEGVSPVTGRVIYEVEPASCLPIPFWAIPVIVVMGSLVVIGSMVLIAAYLILRWLDYREVKRFEKMIQTTNLAAALNPMYMSPTITYQNPLIESTD